MIDREHLESLAKRRIEINKLQSKWNDEFNKYHNEILKKAKEVLKWKDDNLEQQYLQYTTSGHIHDIRSNCVVLCLPDTDLELPNRYYNVSFNELYSDNWKEKALEEYKKKKQKIIEDEKIKKEKDLADLEKWERQQYERLKVKFEGR